MRNSEKILKQKNSLRSGIYINIVLILAGLAAVAVMVHAFGSTLATAIAIYLGYKLLRLVLRVLSLLFSLFITLVSIVILILIISLIF